MAKKVLLLTALLVSQLAQAAQINLEVTTDQADYRVGQTVTWTVYAWASQGDNRGIALVSVDLNDNQGEVLSPPALDGLEFEGTEYGLGEKFIVLGPGTPAASPPRLRDIGVMQTIRLLDIGNDGTQKILARGEYVVTTPGEHQLNVSLVAANYYPNPTANPVAFETGQAVPTMFTVYRRGDINKDGMVNILDLMVLSQQWLGAPGTPSADIDPVNGDGMVDVLDLSILASEWLLGT